MEKLGDKEKSATHHFLYQILFLLFYNFFLVGNIPKEADGGRIHSIA